MVGWIKRFFRRRDPWAASVVRVSRPLSTIHEFAFHTCACLNGSPSWLGGKTRIFFSGSRARVRTKVRDEFWRRRADFFSGSRARGERTSVAGLSKHGFEVQRSRPEFGKLRLLPTQPYRQDWVLARRIPDASGGGGFHSTWISRADMCASCSSQCGSCDSQLSGIRLGSDDGAERHRCDQAC